MVLAQGTFHEPSPPQSFKWLKDGTLYPVRPETRGNSQYWYMQKMINGNTVRVYLGGVGQLEADLLDNAVAHLEAKAQGEAA